MRKTISVLALLALSLLLLPLAAGDLGARLSVSADKDIYDPGQTVRIEARLVHPSPAGRNVTLEVDDPKGEPYYVFTNATDVAGTARFDFVVPKTDFKGKYPVNATCRVNDTILRSETRFWVLPPGEGIDKPRENPVPPGLLVGFGAALIGAAAAVSLTEVGKYGLLALFVPLFSRIKRDETLDNRVRQQVLGHIMENPGVHYNAIKSALELKNGALVYHLQVLEREGFIKSQRDGMLKRFYPAAAKTPEKPKSTPEEIRDEIMGAVRARPGVSQSGIMQRTGRNRDMVGYHLRNMVAEGRIVCWKKENMRVYYPVDTKREK